MKRRPRKLAVMKMWDRWRRAFAREPDTMGLNEILVQLNPQVGLPERQQRLVQLLRWLFQGGKPQVEARFRFFFRALAQQPEWQKNLGQVLNRTMQECDWLRFYTEVGLTIEHGTWADLANRTLGQFLPVGNRHDFYYVVAEAWRSPEAQEALRHLSAPTLNQISELFTTLLQPETWALLEEKRRDAVFYMATHVAHYGLSSAIQRRVPNPYQIARSPFYQLSQNLEDLPPEIANQHLLAAREELRAVYDHLDQNGVSVDIVNSLETAQALISRLEVFIALRASAPAEKPKRVRAFLVSLATSIENSTSVSGYLARHFYLLSRKIVERNGHSGEHYIARNSSELRSLFYSAIGGGVIVVGMTIFKILFLHRNPPLLIMALGLWAIYAGGFLMMQFTGTTLATKIPSFTASRLAGYLKTTRQVDEAGFRLDVRQVLKSQSLALLGNFVGVIPVTLLINWLLQKSFGGPGFLDLPYAYHVLENLNPFLSLAIPLAALTGFQLWLSSLAGGWFENWIVFNRIPESIRESHRLRLVFGETGCAKLSDWVLHQSSGFATNIALGFLFGFFPIWGLMLGLDWSGHHVTIATTSAVFAMSALAPDLSMPFAVAAVAGLLCIGMMNFLVSFALALFIAASARKMQFFRILYYLRLSLSFRPRSAAGQDEKD